MKTYSALLTMGQILGATTFLTTLESGCTPSTLEFASSPFNSETTDGDGPTRIFQTPPTGSIPGNNDPLAPLDPVTPVDPVCDPFQGGSAGTSIHNGLLGSIASLPSELYLQANSAFYFWNTNPQTHALEAKYPVSSSLVMNDVNVPTRAWSSGFVAQNGSAALKDADGNELVEYFSIQVESVLKLSAHDEPGVYQLSLLADDGAIIQIKDPGSNTYRTMVDVDGIHETKMGCAAIGDYLQMDANSAVPIRVIYHQGPRYHIALVALWRRVTDASQLAQLDDLCGERGNTLFYNSSSQPTQAYRDLLARGWNPIAADNFFLSGTTENPCQ